MLRRFLMNRLQEVNRNPQDGQVLRERLEHGDVRTDDRHVLATIVRATYASQERLQASRPSAHTTPQPKATCTRALAQVRGSAICSIPQRARRPQNTSWKKHRGETMA
jgi:hypothetical protein